MAASANSTSRCALRRKKRGAETHAHHHTRPPRERSETTPSESCAMGYRHAVGDGDSGSGVSRYAENTQQRYGDKRKRTRAENKIEPNRDRTHLGSITWWGEYDLTKS